MKLEKSLSIVFVFMKTSRCVMLIAILSSFLGLRNTITGLLFVGEVKFKPIEWGGLGAASAR